MNFTLSTALVVLSQCALSKRTAHETELRPSSEKPSRDSRSGLRIDPADDEVISYEALARKYKGMKWSTTELKEYWKDMEIPIAEGRRRSRRKRASKEPPSFDNAFQTHRGNIEMYAPAFSDKLKKAFPKPSQVKIPNKSGRPEDPKKTKLKNLLRYLNSDDESKFPRLQPMELTATKRYDGMFRLKNPFEHVCGGNQDFNRSLGNDGRSNFISFSNAEVDKDASTNCKLYYDKGQRRTKIFAPRVGHGAVIIDLSSYEKAMGWCYHGGSINTGKYELKFFGAKDASPFPFLCAMSAYQSHLRCGKCGAPPDDWWTSDHRKLIAHKCAEWASASLEVLVMPDPERILAKISKNWVDVETDREPATNQCLTHIKDKCVSFNTKTNTVCCCSNATCSWEACPGGVNINAEASA